MSAANTFECFRECVGLRVVGVLRDALPPTGGRGLRSGNKTLVFDDGTGLTIASNGSYWREHAPEIQRAIRQRRDELAVNDRDIRDVLELAGAAGGDA